MSDEDSGTTVDPEAYAKELREFLEHVADEEGL